MSKATTALANLAKANSDPLRHLANLTNTSNAAAEQWPDEYRATVAAVLAANVNHPDAGEITADAAAAVGREMLKNPPADDTTETVAAYCRRIAAWTLRDTLRNARRDDTRRTATAPQPVTLDDLASDPAPPDSDPQNAYRWTPVGLANAADLAACRALRAATLPVLPNALRLPAERAEQVTEDRKNARRQVTENDRDSLPGVALTRARTGARLAMMWDRFGWMPDTEHGRMTPRAPLPSSGPATPVVEYRRNRTVARIDGLPWREYRAALGLPDDTSGDDTAAAVLGLWLSADGTASHVITHPAPDADTVPPAQVKEENTRDAREHMARQPVKKPNPRKRPRGGRLGTPASIR